MIVDYAFYSTVYPGSEADATSFPALNARAQDVVEAMTRYQVDDDNISSLPSKTQELYRKAICAQVDFLAINGTEMITSGGGGGFTVGKVTVHEKTSASGAGRMSASISPAVIQYLEQTGLLYPGVGVAQC